MQRCFTGKVIAEGRDGRQQHPLHHAAIVAIGAAAERDRRLWPLNDSGAPLHGSAAAQAASSLRLNSSNNHLAVSYRTACVL